MKSLFGLLGALVVGGGTLVAQNPTSLPSTVTSDGTPVQMLPAQPGVSVPTLAQPTPAENWQNGPKPYAASAAPTCYPIGTELYFRSGPSLIIGGGAPRQALNTTGLQIQGGGRSLFFDDGGASAWAIDLGLNFIYNNGSSDHRLSLVQGFYNETATIRNIDRTAAQFGIGREWFPTNSAVVNSNSSSFWKYGVDAGLRWGTGHTSFNNIVANSGATPINRKQDVFGATYIGFDLDLEVPMGGTWSYVFGFRNEWAYTFSSLVPGNRSYIYETSLLLHAGLRF